MKNGYLLALDLGTSSIGYVVFGVDESLRPNQVLDLGVRIFSDGRDPKSKEPLAVERRTARGIRRNRDRGQNRVRRLVKELIEFNLLPKNEKQRQHVFQEYCPYYARQQSVQREVDANTLGRALFHLGRRRGFKSNRLSGSDEESEYKNKIAALREKLGHKTLGEYLYQKVQENSDLVSQGKIKEQQVVRFRGGETEFYADRKMYQEEFNRIKEKQGLRLLSEEQWSALEETIFWQYPLKPVPKGKCRFFPEEQRAQISLPVSHQFRIYQEVNSLRYQSEGKEYKLDERQRHALIDLLDKQKTLTFKSLLSKKDEHKSPLFPSDAIFNLDVESRNGKLLGNSTIIDLRKSELLGDLADQLLPSKLNDIINHLIEPIKKVDGKQVVVDTPELKQWLASELPELTEEQITRLCQHKFKRDTASVSRKFMELINPILKEHGCIYSDAVQQLENEQGIQLHHSHFQIQEFDLLPYYGVAMPESVWGEQPESDKNKAENERDNDAYQHGKIANPTVHVALNQLRVVVNHVIDKFGEKPQKIHIELTRDLKNSKDARAKISKQQAANKRNNDRIRKFLAEELSIMNPSRDDMQKVKLWEELGKQGTRMCVFTGAPISCKQLFSGEVEVEHIIPFSRCYDDGMDNKTLAFKSINNKKLNKTPDEAFSGAVYDSILYRAYNAFGNSPKYKRFKQNAFEEFYGGEKGDMIARQINDTKYISRKAAQYLRCICPKIISVNGQMTAVMRDVWQLNQYKNRDEGHYRDDHRHHIVDAFVVGLTSQWLIRELMTRRSHQQQSRQNLYHFLKNRAPEITELTSQLNKKLDSVVANYKQDHSQQGSMFNETAYGIYKDKEGHQFVVTRKKVSDLSFKEVFQIRGKYYRDLVLKSLCEDQEIDINILKIDDCVKKLKKIVGTEKDLALKLQLIAKKNNIRSLKLIELTDSVKPIQSASNKGYKLNAYAYCDVWQVPHRQDRHSGRWSFRFEGSFVSYAEVKKYQVNPKRPVDKDGRSHPAAKKLMRLYKQDSIQLIDKLTGEVTIMRVAGYHRPSNRIDVQLNLNASPKKQNYKSINRVFSENQVHKLPPKLR